jgi:hypothetical protein
MSRSIRHAAPRSRWQRSNTKRVLETLEHRANRRQTRALLADEARVGRLEDVTAEILADAEEEAGRLLRAEQLRRGRDIPPMP